MEHNVNQHNLTKLLEEKEIQLEILKSDNKRLQEELEHLKPKVLFADAVMSSETSILIGDLAKMLKQNGLETGQKRLFRQLRNDGYLIKKGDSKNMPTQKAMKLGLFDMRGTAITQSDGTVHFNKTTKVTGKGQLYFIQKYLVDQQHK